ncbi:MAG: iron-containing alcohol dehydrogenase [Eubacteriales bacterium]|nr:iron-containing alcohol dehydrogenase [Eubacteriales bacterium]
MNDFIYENSTKIYFGKDQLRKLSVELCKHGKRVLLTYGGGSVKTSGLYDKVVEEIKKSGLQLFELPGIEPNPRIESVRKGAEICKREKIDVLLAVGGGSTIDATKYIAAAACVDFDPWDFFSKFSPLKEALPVVIILTHSATGSEMNTGGVISNLETKEKIGRLARPLLPKASFLDPTNTYTVGPYQTACGSADIMSHIIEVYFNMNKGLYMVDCFMEGMMKTVIKYAPIAMKEPDNYEARSNLMWASSWGINGFISSGKRQAWSCHSMEHELSAFYDITHGLGLAILTPRWMEYCLDETKVSKYYQFGTNVFGIDPTLEPMTVAKKSIEMLSDFLFNTLGLQSTLTEIGIGKENFPIMAKKACEGEVIAGFKPLAQKDIEKIFEMCL